MKRYRIRKGWFGRAVLQELVNSPTLMGGVVDATIRTYWWRDVKYETAMYSEYLPNREVDHL